MSSRAYRFRDIESRNAAKAAAKNTLGRDGMTGEPDFALTFLLDEYEKEEAVAALDALMAEHGGTRKR